jgi:hypothetical protein
LLQEDFRFKWRHEVRKTPDYLFEIDEYVRSDGQQLLLVHFRVDNWTVSAFKQIKREWGLFRQCVTAPLFGSPQEDTPRWHRFVRAMGFEPFTQVLCLDGIERPLYIHKV